MRIRLPAGSRNASVTNARSINGHEWWASRSRSATGHDYDRAAALGPRPPVRGRRPGRAPARVIITRNGHDAAVVISPDDLAQLEETLSVLSDPEALADIREADAAYARGDVVRGVEAVRRLGR